MARIRSIKPEFFTSEQIAECSPNVRLMFIGMWCFSDDYGVSPANVHRIKTQVFPSDPFSKDEIRVWVNKLIEVGLVQEYEVGGEKFWFITGWDKHQKPDCKTGLYPRPDGNVGAKIRRMSVEQSPNVQRTFTDHSCKEKEKEKEKDKEKEKEIARSDKPKRSSPLVDDEFITSLKNDPTYEGIDIDHEVGKATRWVDANPGRKMSKKFFTNWMNNVSKPPKKREEEATIKTCTFL
jgi:hypothetical protein